MFKILNFYNSFRMLKMERGLSLVIQKCYGMYLFKNKFKNINNEFEWRPDRLIYAVLIIMLIIINVLIGINTSAIG